MLLFISGLLVGSVFGALAMALCAASGQASRLEEQQEQECLTQNHTANSK